MDINIAESTVRYSNFTTDLCESIDVDLVSKRDLIFFLDQSLFKLKNLIGNEDESVILLGHKGESNLLFDDMERAEIIDETSASKDWNDLLPKKFRSPGTNKVYYDMTEKKIETNDSNRDIIRAFFLVKLLESIKNAKIILVLKRQAYNSESDHYFLANLPSIFDTIISFKKEIALIFVASENENNISEQIKSDINLFRSAPVNLINLDSRKNTNLDYLGSNEFMYNILTVNSENNKFDTKFTELIETLPYKSSDKFDLQNSLSSEIIDTMIKIINKLTDDTIIYICRSIQGTIQKYFEDLDENKDLQLNKDTIDSLKTVQITISDFIKISLSSGKEYKFFSIVSEKIIFLCKDNNEAIKKQLEQFSFYYYFFLRVQAESSVRYYFKLKEWLEHFENIKYSIEKIIYKEEMRLREIFQLSVCNTKKLTDRVQCYYTNNILGKYGKVNPGFFMQTLFDFKNKYSEIIALLQNIEYDMTNEKWLRLIDTINENVLKIFLIEFKIEEVKSAFELKLILKETNSFEIDFIKELRQFEGQISIDYARYLSKCILDLKQIVSDQIKEYTHKLEIFCKKEKIYKNLLNIKGYFELVCLKKENFKDFVESLKQLHPQIQEQAIIDIINIHDLLYKHEIFYFSSDKDMFKKEFIEASASIGKIISCQIDILWAKLVNDSKLQLEESFKEIKSNLTKICNLNSNKTIGIYQKLNIFLNESNELPESLGITVKALKKKLIEEDTSLDDKIILSESLNKLEISEYLNENSETKSTFFKGILDLKQFFELNYQKFLREKLNFIWNILSENIKSLNSGLEKRYAYEAKVVIDLLMEFVFILKTNKKNYFTIIQIMGKLLNYEECFSKNFSSLAHFFNFKSVNDYLIELQKNYKAEEIKIEFYSYNDTGNQLNCLLDVLKSSNDYWIEETKFLAIHSLLRLKNDFEEKIQKENIAENYTEIKEYSSKMLGSLEEIKATTKDVSTFASLILEKIGFSLSEETIKHFELIIKDNTNDSKFILKELDKLVVSYLKEKIEHSIKSMKTKEENLKIAKIKKCFEQLKNDVEECLKKLNDDQKCLIFILSLLSVLREIRDLKATKNIMWICLKLNEFWKCEISKEPLKSTTLSIEELNSQEFLEDMSKEYFIDSPIPIDSYNEIKSVYEVFKARKKNFEDSIRQNEELYANSLLKAVEIFEKEISEYIKIRQDKSWNKSSQLMEKIRDSTKVNKINEIASLLIFDFESLLVNSESSRLFEELKAKEISFVHQINVQKSIKKILNIILNDLNKMVKELEVKTYKDMADSIAAKFVHIIEELIKKEIEKPTGFTVFLNFLENLKKFFDKIDFEKLNEFYLNLLDFSLQFNSKINDIEVIKDKDISFHPQTQSCLYNLKETLKFRLNWYKLIKIIFEKINEGCGFESGSISINDSQTEIEDTEYLQKLLRKLNINIEKSMFNWSQSLSFSNLEKIKNTELTATQKYELQLISKQVVKNFESFYDLEKKRLIIQGNFIVMSNVLNEVEKNDTVLVIIKANNVVYFDKDISANGISFFIISPYWYVKNSVIINLSGINANQHEQKKAKDGINDHINGENGLDGCSGQDSGHFAGICGRQTIYDSIKKLNFLIEGGNGADGQHGGDGKMGEHGKNALPIHIDDVNNFNITEQNDIKISVKVTGFLIKTPIKVFKRSGGEGERGGNGGNGGNGGQGGYGGSVRILIETKFLNCNGQTGFFGKSGRAGMFGKGGKHGNDFESYWDMKNKKWIEENKSIEKKYANDGCVGLDGKVLKPIKNSSSKLNSEEIKFLIQEQLDKKVFLEKNDIFLKLQFEHLNKFYDELQVYLTKTEYFIDGKSF